MTINNEIHSTAAGLIWLALGVFGVLWLGARGRRLHHDIGGWRYFFRGNDPEASAHNDGRVMAFQLTIFACAAVWLLVFLFLDWLF